MNAFYFLCQRTIIFFALLYFVANGITDYNKIYAGTEAKILTNLDYQSFAYLAQTPPQNLTQEKLKDYVYFYKNLNGYLPEKSDALEILGYCYYYSGETDKALRAYQKTIRLNANSFEAHYNLAIIYYQKGDYDKARELLEKALAIAPEKALHNIRSSKIVYQSILKNTPYPNNYLSKEIQNSYKNALALLVLSYYHLKDFKNLAQQAALGLMMQPEREEFFRYFLELGSKNSKINTPGSAYLERSLQDFYPKIF